MNNALTGLILLFLVSACTSARYPVSGPYLQIRNPVNGEVMGQMAFASSGNCAVMLQAGMQASGVENLRGTNIISCTDSSASPDLPYQVTFREPAGYTINLETRTLDFCRYLSSGWREEMKKEGSGGGGTTPSPEAGEITFPCGEK